MSFSPNAMLLCDYYKLSHRECYPKKMEVCYSTWTPRISRVPGVTEVVAFGFQAFIKKYLIEYFTEQFFDMPKERITSDYKRVIKATLGISDPDTSHIEALHGLGYLPIKIKAVKEGTRVPIRCPMLTIENTKPEFFWLTNYLETLFSCEQWMPTTSATIANEYRKILEMYALKTVGDIGFVQFQGHDFSMRGMAGLEASMLSGAGHLLSFVGTDTIPAISYLEEYYNADIEKELVGTSVNADEHSVAQSNILLLVKKHGVDLITAEKMFLERMLTEVYPSGMFSYVADTFSFFDVLTQVLPPLKDKILARKPDKNGNAKLIIRPDSGDPVKILCGDPEGKTEAERKGAVECLWDLFGGMISEQGYKVLDPHIGLIYGDAITLERCNQICASLYLKGFASTNVVYGIGSFTYQFVTRDTFGFALKSTHVVIGGEELQIYKDPKTDNGMKKSQKGMVCVFRDIEGKIFFVDELEEAKINSYPKLVANWDLLEDVFVDGKLMRDESLSEIRARLRS